MLADIGLVLSVVCAGLWSGLLLTLTTTLYPLDIARDGAGFATDVGRFLTVARRSLTNYALVIGLVVAPVLALVGLRDDLAGAPFVLTALGLVLTVAGPLLVSRLLSEPTYDVILGWDPRTCPPTGRPSATGGSPSTGSAGPAPGSRSRSSSPPSTPT